jgi:hypothetical protein
MKSLKASRVRNAFLKLVALSAAFAVTSEEICVTRPMLTVAGVRLRGGGVAFHAREGSFTGIIQQPYQLKIRVQLIEKKKYFSRVRNSTEV